MIGSTDRCQQRNLYSHRIVKKRRPARSPCLRTGFLSAVLRMLLQMEAPAADETLLRYIQHNRTNLGLPEEVDGYKLPDPNEAFYFDDPKDVPAITSKVWAQAGLKSTTKAISYFNSEEAEGLVSCLRVILSSVLISRSLNESLFLALRKLRMPEDSATRPSQVTLRSRPMLSTNTCTAMRRRGLIVTASLAQDVWGVWPFRDLRGPGRHLPRLLQLPLHWRQPALLCQP